MLMTHFHWDHKQKCNSDQTDYSIFKLSGYKETINQTGSYGHENNYKKSSGMILPCLVTIYLFVYHFIYDSIYLFMVIFL